MQSRPDTSEMDRQLEQSIFTEGQGYAARNARSKEENKGRAAARERIKQLGMSPQAFGAAVALVKSKTPREIEDYLRDFNLSVRVLSQKQADLFPEEQAAALKREQLREQKAAPLTGREGAPDPDQNPRSDPNKGGAKPRTGRAAPKADAAPAKKPGPKLTVVGTGDNVQMAPAPGTSMAPPPVPVDDEQAEGAKVLSAVDNLGKPKSQSQIAAEKLEAARLN